MLSIHHLIKPAQAEALLVKFSALVPGSSLALLRPDGILFASSYKKGTPAGERTVPWFETCQLLAGGEIVGLLAACSTGAPLLPALQHTFNLLFQTALEKREVARETLDRYREINLLYSTAETIGACLDADEIPSLVLQESARVIPAEAGLVMLRATEGDGDLELHASYPNASVMPQAAGLVGALLDSARDLIDHVMSTGRPDIRSNDSAGHRGPFQSLLCSPLKARERALGAVLLGRARAGVPSAFVEIISEDHVKDVNIQFTAGEEKLLTALTSQAGIAIEKAWLHRRELQRQRLEQELAIGRRIQHNLLPEALPERPGWEFAAFYQAAREIGGDFYDFYERTTDDQPQAAEETMNSHQPGSGVTNSSSLGIFMADVTGKGIPAALMMAFIRAMLRALLRNQPQSVGDPSEVLQRLNNLFIQDNRTGLLLTALYAHLDPHTGHLAVANAGHEQPFWLHAATGECQAIDARGMLLGAFPNLSFEAVRVELAPGDLLVIYTDGLSEARNSDDQLFGEDRVAEVIRSLDGRTAQDALQTILQQVHFFSGSIPQSDDFTVIIIKRLSEQ